MKVWIHQIKESMSWQRGNYKLLKNEYEEDPTEERLNAYIESYGKFCKLEGRYEQWHTDQQELEGQLA